MDNFWFKSHFTANFLRTALSESRLPILLFDPKYRLKISSHGGEFGAHSGFPGDIQGTEYCLFCYLIQNIVWKYLFMEENLEPIQGFQAIFHEQNIPPVGTNHRQNHISQITYNGTSVSKIILNCSSCGWCTNLADIARKCTIHMLTELRAIAI